MSGKRATTGIVAILGLGLVAFAGSTMLRGRGRADVREAAVGPGDVPRNVLDAAGRARPGLEVETVERRVGDRSVVSGYLLTGTDARGDRFRIWVGEDGSSSSEPVAGDPPQPDPDAEDRP